MSANGNPSRPKSTKLSNDEGLVNAPPAPQAPPEAFDDWYQ